MLCILFKVDFKINEFCVPEKMLSRNDLKKAPPAPQGRGSMQSQDVVQCKGVMHSHPNPMVQGKEARLLR